ncbi:MAG: radical SAM protein, partial [Planctomycetota bacterium]
PVVFVITGGDPLKRAGLESLVAYGSRLGLVMALTPSATPLLTTDAVKRFKDAGLQRIAISVDGADAKTHDDFRGVPGTFQRSMDILEAARRSGIETQINSSIGRHNAGQLSAMADIAAWQGVSLWSVFLLVPTGRAETDMLLSAVEHERLYLKLANLALNPDTKFQTAYTRGGQLSVSQILY